MRLMKKCSGFIAFLLIASMLSTVAFADQYNIEDDDVHIKTDTEGQWVSYKDEVKKDANPVITGTSDENDVLVSVGETDANITFKDLHVNDAVIIYDGDFDTDAKATINLEGSSSVTSEDNGIYSDVDLTIRSDNGAELSLDAKETGISGLDSLQIDNVNLTINQNNDADYLRGYGIIVWSDDDGSLTITDSEVKVNAASAAINVSGKESSEVTINSSDVTLETPCYKYNPTYDDYLWGGTGIDVYSEGNTTLNIEDSKLDASGAYAIYAASSYDENKDTDHVATVNIKSSEVNLLAGSAVEESPYEYPAYGDSIDIYGADEANFNIVDSNVVMDSGYGSIVYSGGNSRIYIENSYVEAKSYSGDDEEYVQPAMYAFCEGEGKAEITVKDCGFAFPSGAFVWTESEYDEEQDETYSFACVAVKDKNGDPIYCSNIIIDIIDQLASSDPFKMTDLNGKKISYTRQNKDGVLTITAEDEEAILSMTPANVKTLLAMGIKTVVFVVGEKQVSFDLAAVYEQMTQNAGAVSVTIKGGKATLTIGDKDFSDLLK